MTSDLVGPRDVLPEPAIVFPRDPKRSAFLKWEPNQMTLTPWDKNERKKFGLPETPTPGLRIGGQETPEEVWTDIEKLVPG